MIYNDLYKIHLLQILYNRQTFKESCLEAGISQSAFSQQMTLLQKQLKKTLFTKSKGRVNFTQDGEELVQKSSHLLNQIHSFESTLHKPSQETTDIGEITMGSYGSMAANLMPNLVATLQSQHKSFYLKLDTDRSGSLETKVQNGELDLALIVNPIKTRSVKIHALGKSQFGLFVSSRHNISHMGLERAMETYGMATINADPVTGGRPHYYTRFMKKIPVTPRVVFSTNSFEVIRSMTVQGQIVGLLPTWVAQRNSSELSCEWAGETGSMGEHSLCLVHRTNLDPVIVKTMLEQLEKYFFTHK